MKKQCIIIGGGASIGEGINLSLWEKIKGLDIWSINFAYKTMPFLPARQMWIDINFFTKNVGELQKLYKQGVKMYAKSHIRYTNIPEINSLITTKLPENYYGVNAHEKKTYFIGRSGLSGFFALSLAVADRYDEIYLLGFDFGTPSLVDKRTHYYQDRVNELKIESVGIKRPEVYLLPNGMVKPEVQDFALYLRESQIKIYNVSPLSNISCFDKITYQEFFDKIGV
jgi:hypothetical protein